MEYIQEYYSLYEMRYEIALPLKILSEPSYKYSQLPQDWRSANVTPIYKKGSKLEAKNYRPVSLTSVCCKLME